MLTHVETLSRAGRARLSLPRLAGPLRHGWANAPEVADLAAFADFNRDRYAITSVPLADIAAADAAALCHKRPCSFADWFAFTAASTERAYVDAAGLYRTSTIADQPRFDWSGGRRRLALSGASTNLLQRSSEFTTSPWAASGAVSITADAGMAPDGTNTADLVADTTAADVNGVTQNCAITSSANPYTVSCFLKAGTSSVASLRVTIGASSVVAEVVADLATGEAQWRSGVAGTAFAITPHANGWYRLAMTCTDNASGNSSINLIVRPAFAASYSATIGIGATGGVLAWGAQIEQSAFATPYIATTSSSVTRAAESCRMSLAIEALLQRSAASIIARGGLAQGTSVGRMIGTVTSSGLICGSTTAGQISTWDAVNSRGLTATLGTGSKTSFGAAHGFDGTGQSLVGNGGTVAGDAHAPDARTTAYLGRSASGGHADGGYDFVGIAPSRLSDARLAALALPA
jgi:hypothetical protein